MVLEYYFNSFSRAVELCSDSNVGDVSPVRTNFEQEVEPDSEREPTPPLLPQIASRKKRMPTDTMGNKRCVSNSKGF